MNEITISWNGQQLARAEKVQVWQPAQPAKEPSMRNHPCPCGSGRKFKKCCMPMKADGNGIEVEKGKRKIPLVRAADLPKRNQK